MIPSVKMKTNANQGDHIQTSPFLPGDNMLVKQTKNSKISLSFNPKLYTVIQRRDSMVTAESDNHQIIQNPSFFKHVQQEVIQPENTIASADDSQTWETLTGWIQPSQLRPFKETQLSNKASCRQHQPLHSQAKSTAIYKIAEEI